MTIININSITSAKLKNGDFRDVLPEFYQLKTAIENNLWHLKQNVLDHAIKVFTGMEQTLKLDFVNFQTKNQLTAYLQEKDGLFTNKELLMVTTLLHDIAKTITLVGNKAESTSCPGHEVIGSLKVTDFASRFGLDAKGEERVRRIVLYHGFIHDLLTLAIAKQNKDTYKKILVKTVPDIYRDLLLLAYADMLGSDLKQTMLGQFKKREKLVILYLETD